MDAKKTAEQDVGPSFSLPPAVLSLIGALECAGHPAYAVGGCVRDLLMGRTPNDYDICTGATPEEMRAGLPGVRLLATGEAHGTLTALVDGRGYELTTFRVDGPYADHRRPDGVRYVSDLRQDLARRDFTINAMAYHPRLGLQDPFGGREDISRRWVRCVGDPALRFGEDALRILRALRFAAQCGFTVEPATAQAALDARSTLAYVARERVLAELNKLLCAPAPERGLAGFSPVLAAAAPGLAPLAGDPEAWARAVCRVCAAPDEAAVRWAALLWEIPERAPALLRALRCDTATRERAEALLAARELPLAPGRTPLLRALRLLGPEAVRQLAALRHLAPASMETGGPDPVTAALDALLLENPCYRLADLAVNGSDLLAMGLEGPAVGRALNALLDAVVDDRVENEREALLAMASDLCV